MADDDSTPYIELGTQDVDFDPIDDAPTDRVSNLDIPPETDPTHAAVIDPATAAEIHQNYAETVQDDERMTFVARVDEDGRLVVPERLLEGNGRLKPGDEILIQAKKID